MNYLRYTPNIQLFSCEGEGSNGETGESFADAGQVSAELSANKKDFDELIKTKYKKEFADKTQEIIDRRFKETKNLENYRDSVKESVDFLLEKFGLQEGEESKIWELLKSEKDDASNDESLDYFDDEATRDENLTDEEYDFLLTEDISRKLYSWILEAEELQNDYPDFDFRNELKGKPVLNKLLLSGVDLKTALKTVYHDEILSGALTYATKKAKEDITNNIALKGQRPQENGTLSQGAVVSSVDVNSLTSQDILKILKQVERGADIKF